MLSFLHHEFILISAAYLLWQPNEAYTEQEN